MAFICWIYPNFKLGKMGRELIIDLKSRNRYNESQRFLILRYSDTFVLRKILLTTREEVLGFANRYRKFGSSYYVVMDEFLTLEEMRTFITIMVKIEPITGFLKEYLKTD